MLRRSKRLRPASAEVQGSSIDAASTPAAAPVPRRHLCLGSFNDLPFELKKRIIDLACRPSIPSPSSLAHAASSETAANTSPRTKVAPLLDLKTTLSLLLTSTSLYALVLPILWRNVSVTRPSALAFFQRTLSAGPQLGALVKSLHAGPADQLPEGFYPLSTPDGELIPNPRATYTPAMLITTSLRSAKEQQLVPQWCDPEGKSVCNRRSTDPHAMDTFETLVAAQRDLDVDLSDDLKSYQAKTLLPRWDYTGRVYEVQAALDLYLMARKRWEDDVASCEPQNGRTFKPLLITGYPTSATPTFAEEPFIITRPQLLQHLARPHSVTDRLDSPLLFARSRIDTIDPPFPPNRPEVLLRRVDRWGHHWSDLFTPARDAVPAIATQDLALPNTATLTSLLALLRMSLAALPNLSNLSLTGLMERAISDPRTAAPFMGSLRSLSIGPPPAYWFGPLHLKGLTELQDLRLCGVKLFPIEATALVSCLDSLRRLEWRMPAECRCVSGRAVPSNKTKTDKQLSMLHRLPEVVDRLAGRREKIDLCRGDHDDASSCSTDSSNSSASLHPERVPLIDLRLHRSDFDALLARAPSAAVREAWLTGDVVKGQDRPLLLTKSNIAASGKWWEGTHTAYGEMHAEGREWWMRRGGMSGGK